MTTDSNVPRVLNPEHCDCLDRVLQSVAETREILERCKRCNLPVEELVARNEEHGRLAASLKQQFFPERP